MMKMVKWQETRKTQYDSAVTSEWKVEKKNFSSFKMEKKFKGLQNSLQKTAISLILNFQFMIRISQLIKGKQNSH